MAVTRLIPLFLLVTLASSSYDSTNQTPMNRGSFPHGFIFGTASSAYQYEGAATEGGKGPSIWDTFTHQHPDKIADQSNGDLAVDSYHLYKEDARIMKHMGMDAYRLSISWTRIFPNGSLSGGVNQEGVRYYKNLINELLLKGVQPFVILFNWDSPQALEDKYGGFLSPNIINDYKNFAEFCFEEFGDRVKHWITFYEPWSFCATGYASGHGMYAPGRCSPGEKDVCNIGDSGREPYTVCHHQLLAHAETVRLYREKYQAVQKGKIGITLISHWFVPFSDSDEGAVRRALDFMLGWFMDPLTRGDYPQSMRQLVGNRLPLFTEEQSKLIKGAFDFIGLDYYTTHYVGERPPSGGLNNSFNVNTDSRVKETGFRNGVPIGPQGASSWIYVYPEGLRELLLYIKESYGNPAIYITENGVDEAKNKSIPLQEALKDDSRIEYHKEHLLALLSAIRDGANVKGYFAWSLLDHFEWIDGYTVRFGIYYVAYDDGLKRYPKKSAHWFKEFLQET
ncbi:hypothetical protein EJB05_30422, partial [Eragrostis curvula]